MGKCIGKSKKTRREILSAGNMGWAKDCPKNAKAAFERIQELREVADDKQAEEKPEKPRDKDAKEKSGDKDAKEKSGDKDAKEKSRDKDAKEKSGDKARSLGDLFKDAREKS